MRMTRRIDGLWSHIYVDTRANQLPVQDVFSNPPTDECEDSSFNKAGSFWCGAPKLTEVH